MKNYIQKNKEHVFFFALGVVVFGLTFTAFSVDAQTFVLNQPPSCTITLKDVPTGYPTVSAPQGSGYPMLLSWGSSNATSASISPSMGSVPPVGSRVVYVRGERFSMAVYGSNGRNATCQTTEYLLPSPYFADSIVAGPIMNANYLSSLYAPTYAQHTNYPTLATTPKPTIYPTFQPVQGQVIAQAVPQHISLTQIPYTGVGDVMLAMFAWLSIIAVALVGAVAIAQRGDFVEKVAARLRG